MNGFLVVCDAWGDPIEQRARELIAAATQLRTEQGQGERITLALIGSSARSNAEVLSHLEVDEVIVVPTASEQFEAWLCAQCVEEVLAHVQPAVVLLAHSANAMGYGPAVAARQGLGLATDVVRVSSRDGLAAVRGAYGGKLEAEVALPDERCCLLMLRPGALAPEEGMGEPCIREVTVDVASHAVEHLGVSDVEVADVDITSADFLISIGRGIKDPDAIPQFERLAARMGATLSASRPLVDAGWISNARQVGQSGRTVAPKVYLAFGISGAVQHIAGMSQAKTIIAVNSDPYAPIFGVAHYGAVADLFAVAAALEQRLQ